MAADPEVFAAVQKKYMPFGRSSFPILFEDGKLRIYKNPCNEIFAQDIKSGAEIRINSFGYLRGGLQFTTDQRVEPAIVNGVVGWNITRR